MKTFDKLLSEYRQVAFHERDEGTRFEKLMQKFMRPIRLIVDDLLRFGFGMKFPSVVILATGIQV